MGLRKRVPKMLDLHRDATDQLDNQNPQITSPLYTISLPELADFHVPLVGQKEYLSYSDAAFGLLVTEYHLHVCKNLAKFERPDARAFPTYVHSLPNAKRIYLIQTIDISFKLLQLCFLIRNFTVPAERMEPEPLSLLAYFARRLARRPSASPADCLECFLQALSVLLKLLEKDSSFAVAVLPEETDRSLHAFLSGSHPQTQVVGAYAPARSSRRARSSASRAASRFCRWAGSWLCTL